MSMYILPIKNIKYSHLTYKGKERQKNENSDIAIKTHWLQTPTISTVGIYPEQDLTTAKHIENLHKFWGVDSQTEIDCNLVKQCSLSILKSHELNCAALGLTTVEDFFNTFWENHKLYYDKITKYNMGRITFYFRRNDMHTIGFYKKDDTLYILDSLGEENERTSKYHLIAQEKLSQTPVGEIQKFVFNRKTQQKSGYSCNNWTWANLETINNAFKNNAGLNINTSGELDAILPSANDENKILHEQRQYLLKNISSIPIFHHRLAISKKLDNQNNSSNSD